MAGIARFTVAPYRDLQTIVEDRAGWVATTRDEIHAGFGPTPIDAMADLIDVMAKALESHAQSTAQPHDTMPE